MTWFPFAVTCAVLYSLISISDKIVLEKFCRNNFTYPFITFGLVSIVSCTIFVGRSFLGLVSISSLGQLVFALLPGIFYYIAGIISAKALLRTDVSTALSVQQVGPIFALFFSYLIWHDRFAWTSIMGILLIISSAFFVSLEKNSLSKFKLDSAFGLFLASVFIRCCGDVVLKLTVSDLDFWDAFSLSRMGSLVPVIFMLLNRKIRVIALAPIITYKWELMKICLVIESFAILNMILITKAYSLGPFAFVAATQSVALVLVIFLSDYVQKRFPFLLLEKEHLINKGGKIFFGLLTISGIYLLNLG